MLLCCCVARNHETLVMYLQEYFLHKDRIHSHYSRSKMFNNLSFLIKVEHETKIAFPFLPWHCFP